MVKLAILSFRDQTQISPQTFVKTSHPQPPQFSHKKAEQNSADCSVWSVALAVDGGALTEMFSDETDFIVVAGTGAGGEVAAGFGEEKASGETIPGWGSATLLLVDSGVTAAALATGGGGGAGLVAALWQKN